MNIIKINQLRVETRIGCLAWEQAVKQTLLVDIEYGCDIRQISKNDDIKQAISYSSVAEAATEFAKNADLQLLETWVSQLADQLLKQFQLPWLKLTVTKNGLLPNAKGVSISYEQHA